jgi:RimJ/RimL family protein N-acetyltransferase
MRSPLRRSSVAERPPRAHGALRPSGGESRRLHFLLARCARQRGGRLRQHGAAAVIEEAVRSLGAHRFEAEIARENAPSQLVAIAIGMRVERATERGARWALERPARLSLWARAVRRLRRR